jgi:hypothetical protein
MQPLAIIPKYPFRGGNVKRCSGKLSRNGQRPAQNKYDKGLYMPLLQTELYHINNKSALGFDLTAQSCAGRGRF